MDKRVLLAGLFHETHTFLAGQTSLADFQVRQGKQLLAAAGDGSPLAGALETADALDWVVLPAVDYRATPGPTVADEVFESFWRQFREFAEPVLPTVDGIYLLLHGAMVCQSYLDAEGELLERIRGLPGAERLPICGVVDLHANFSERMARLGDGLIGYRENPHADALRAATHAAELLHRLMQTGQRPLTVWEHPPLMWPPTGTATGEDPMQTLEAAARNLEVDEPHFLAVNVWAGYSFADTPDTGVCFTAITQGNPEEAHAQLRHLSRWAVDHRQMGLRVDLPIETVLAKLAEAQASSSRRGPVVLAEPSDNIGAGAPGDGTALLRALAEHRVENAAVAISDPAAIEQLAGKNIGDRLTLAIGGKLNRMGGPPLTVEVELISRSNGQFSLEDRHSHLASIHGRHIDMGPSAVVRHQSMTILLTSRKTPPFDLGQWRSQGLAPESLSAIVVKAAVGHRRAYDPIASASYSVDTPGPCSSNLATLDFRHVRRPIFPLDDIGPTA
jgi:microcystin degradation protein MlrC